MDLDKKREGQGSEKQTVVTENRKAKKMECIKNSAGKTTL